MTQENLHSFIFLSDKYSTWDPKRPLKSSWAFTPNVLKKWTSQICAICFHLPARNKNPCWEESWNYNGSSLSHCNPSRAQIKNLEVVGGSYAEELALWEPRDCKKKETFLWKRVKKRTTKRRELFASRRFKSTKHLMNSVARSSENVCQKRVRNARWSQPVWKYRSSHGANGIDTCHHLLCIRLTADNLPVSLHSIVCHACFCAQFLLPLVSSPFCAAGASQSQPDLSFCVSPAASCHDLGFFLCHGATCRFPAPHSQRISLHPTASAVALLERHELDKVQQEILKVDVRVHEKVWTNWSV